MDATPLALDLRLYAERPARAAGLPLYAARRSTLPPHLRLALRAAPPGRLRRQGRVRPASQRRQRGSLHRERGHADPPPSRPPAGRRSAGGGAVPAVDNLTSTLTTYG